MDKVIVSGLLLISSLAAAVMTISIITPALGSDRDSITKSNRVATNLVSTGIEGLSAVVEDRNGAVISAWFKNVGSADIKPVSAMDLFLLSGNRFSGAYLEFCSPPCARDGWSVLQPATSAVWARGETIHIQLVLNMNPMTIGAHIISLTTPNGVSGEIHFEYGAVPKPTLTPIPAGLSISRSTASVNESSGPGNTDTFEVVLDSSPSSSVRLSVTSSDPGEVTVAPAILTFSASDWGSPQTVTLTGVDGKEPVADGDQNSNIIVSVVDAFSAAGYRSVGDSSLVATTVDDGCLGPCP